MADAVERAVQTWIATQNEEEIKFIAQEIESASASLLALVKYLGEFLTSEDGEKRVKGITLLVEVIGILPDSSFNKKTTTVISTFFNSKLDSVDEIVPALKGILRLISMPTYTTSDCKDTINELIKINMRAHVQATRHMVFRILDSLFTRYRSTLQELGPDFIKGYISLAEGEKDPRNLLVAFALDRVLLLEFDVKNFAEQFYDITFCYFPITFKAPVNDPFGVTGEDLVTALKLCLCASPLLGPLGMPLFIEKLNAGTPSTKIDTLDTVATCLPVYGKAVCETFGDQLWTGLKVEIFQPVDSGVQSQAVNVTKVLVQTCTHGDLDGELEGITLRILRTTLEILKETDKSRSRSALKVLSAMIGSSENVAERVWEALIPQLIESYDSAKDTSARMESLEAFATVLQNPRASESGKPSNITSIVTHKDAILSRFISSVQVASTMESSLHALSSLIQLQVCSKDELNYVVHTLTGVLLGAATSGDDMTLEILTTLSNVAKYLPDVVKELTLPALFALLPERAPENHDTKARVECVHALMCLENLCISPDLFSRLCIHFLTKVEILVESLATSGPDDASIAYSHALLRTISVVLDVKRKKDHPDIAKYIERFVPQLYFLFFNNALNNKEGRPGLSETVLVTDASEIISVVVGCLDYERQRAWVNTVFEAYFRGKPGLIAFSHGTVSDTNVFNPLEASQPVNENLMPLFTAAVVSLRPETTIPHHNLSELLNQLMLVAFTCGSARKRNALMGAVASILNKHADECPEFIEASTERFWSENIEDRTLPVMQRTEALTMWSAVCQALVVRNHPKAIPMIKRILVLFEDSTISQHAARSVGQIPILDGSTISKKNHASIRLLYIQKLLNSIGPDIKANCMVANTSTMSDAYLTAVSTLTPSIPKGTFTQMIDILFPLLIRGPELQDLGLRANVVDSFVVIVSKNEKAAKDVITTHLGTLIGAMLKNTRSEKDKPSSVRLKVCALRFLTGVAGMINQEDLQPFRSRVLRELQIALDDHSKAVRHEAVTARSAWFKRTA